MLTFLSALVFYLIYFRKNLSSDTHEVPESLIKNYSSNRSYPQELGDLNNTELVNELSRLRKELSRKSEGVDTNASDTLRAENNELKIQIERLKNELGSLNDSPSVKKLQQENEELGLKLKEYEVIESDLANLKQIQDENTRLKELIRGKDLEAEFQDDLSKIAGEKQESEPENVISGIDEAVQDAPGEIEASDGEPPLDEARLETTENANKENEEARMVVEEPGVNEQEEDIEQELSTKKDEEKSGEEAKVVSLEKDGVEKSADELLSEFEKMLG